MAAKIRKILIANRGEIAVRVIRACRDLGIRSVAVFSEADQAAFHVRMADEAYLIGPAPSAQSYLVQDRMIDAARQSGADAIHPGYGFLSENGSFAKRCVDEGIIFIGPQPETIDLLGDKLEARSTALKAGLPLIHGAAIEPNDIKSALKAALLIGFPVLVKAAAGGGGKGMRTVHDPALFEESLLSAANEARSAFGDDRVYLEKYLNRPRHVEIQILGDQHGHYIHLGERECSIQRRHQKVIEESPSPIMTPELRTRMGRSAVEIARRSGYVGAGTVEFLVDEDRSFYFLEVNTRLQVEHPVTEMVTGIDLVKEQIAVAEGQPLTLQQEDVMLRGHAVECRIYAEDPDNGFFPSTGVLRSYDIPAGPGIRVDSGVVSGSEIPIFYDPLIAKLLAWGKDRPEAISRMKRALEEYRISGVETTVGFHRVIMDNEAFLRGDLSTGFLQEEYPDHVYRRLNDRLRQNAALAAAVEKFVKDRQVGFGREEHAPGTQSEWVRFHRRRSLRTSGGSR